MSLAQLRSQALRMERTIHWRNLREYVAGLVGAALLAPAVVLDDNPLVRLGAALMIAAVGFIVYRIAAAGRVRRMPEDLGRESAIDFHRAELVRQRDLLRGVWAWYLLPIVPGGALITIGRALERPEHRLSVALAAAVVALVFVGIGWLNARAAAAVQRSIDELER